MHIYINDLVQECWSNGIIAVLCLATEKFAYGFLVHSNEREWNAQYPSQNTEQLHYNMVQNNMILYMAQQR